MLQALVGALVALLSTAVARVMIGAGLAFITYQGVTAAVDTFIAEIEIAIGEMPTKVVQILGLLGVGQAFSILISTASGVAAVAIAGKIAGVRFK